MSTPTAQTFEEWWIEQGQERWASGLSYGEIAQAAWNAAAQQGYAEGYAEAKEEEQNRCAEVARKEQINGVRANRYCDGQDDTARRIEHKIMNPTEQSAIRELK